MTAIRHLKHAPIVEALIDFRVAVPSDFDVERFAQIGPTIASVYPVAEKQFHFAASIALNFTSAAPPTATFASPRGYLFKTADGQSIAQFRLDGFTFNKLGLYTSWEQIRPEAMRLWRRFVEVTQTAACTRLGLRYINHINVPIPGTDLEDYLATPPAIPQGIDGGVTHFFSRAVIVDPRTNLSAIVTQASQDSVTPRAATIVLDIDTYREFEPPASDAGTLDRTLDALHDLKNRLFFGSITERTATEYE